MPTRDLNNSRRLDVHRWSDHPEVNKFVYELFDAEIAPELPSLSGRGRKPRCDIKYQFKVLILDLYLLWCEDPDACLGVSRTDSHYKEGSIYNALHISTLIVRCVDALVDLGYIEQKLGTESAKQVTRIWPTTKLITLFQSALFSVYDIGLSDKIELIVLNMKVRSGQDDSSDDETSYRFVTKPQEYKDKDFKPIVEMRESLRAYNKLLQHSYIDIADLSKPVISRSYWDQRTNQAREYRVHVGQHNKLVRRVFYRGDWSLGGRFHGGWWQQIKSEYRRRILIDDQYTVEIDYSGLHISLAYALEGVQPPKDPYLLPDLLLDGVNAVDQRKIVKSLVLMAINAKTRKDAYQAFRAAQDKGSYAKKLTNVELETLLDAFVDTHPAVAHYIAADKGVELMALDGRITASVIDYFTERNVVVLTVHDSYIVPEDREHELLRVMNRAVHKELGEYQIDMQPEGLTMGAIRGNSLLTESPLGVDIIKQLTESKPSRCSEYCARRDKFKAAKGFYIDEKTSEPI